MNKICGIYKITSPSGKIYIGQSKDIYKRIEIYRNIRCKAQTKLYNSLTKYGWLNHKFEIICECDESQLNCLEIMHIKTHNSFNSEHGLNLTSGGYRGNLSEESKQKISIANKDNKYCVGRIISEETKQKIGNSNKDKQPRLGAVLSQVTKDKIGHSNKGKIRTETMKKNMSVSLMGHAGWNVGTRHTDITKEKIRISSTNRKHTEETKRKISESNKGRVFTIEHRKKLSESMKCRIPWNLKSIH